MCKSLYTRQEIHQLHKQSGLTRREFGKLLGALGLLGYIDSHSIAMAASTGPSQIGMLANQTAGAEGTWWLKDIEGEIPKEINGTLYRTAPGESERFGVKFKHAFDGDAFVSGYSMRDGKLWLNARFVNSPERIKEQAAGKMMYSEFGTLAPGAKGPTNKNQPSVNIIPWDGRLLGLSEGGHPTAVNAQDMSFEAYWDFHGTLPKNVSFTAHPKYDPATGEGFAYGMEQGPSMALCVFRMNPEDGTLTMLHKVPQKGFFMLHDMFITTNHFVFAIPPVKYNLGALFSGKVSVAQAIKYFEKEPLRFIILKRNGSGKPIVIEQPANMCFHNGNAFEKDGKIIVDTFLQPDGYVLESLQSIDKNGNLPAIEQPSRFTRFTIDLEKAEIISRTEIAEDQDFPRFDIRQSGKEAKHLYVGEGDTEDNDPLRIRRIVRHDFGGGQSVFAEASKRQSFGEPVFAPKSGPATEDNGWIMNLIYDGDRNETALDIRDAATLELQARAWTGQDIPLGFHGNFMPGWHVNEPA
ncbi:MAG: carotenoid oxygenase family protein [Candidatus Hydrogenedentota bacterium]